MKGRKFFPKVLVELILGRSEDCEGGDVGGQVEEGGGGSGIGFLKEGSYCEG